MRYKITAFLIFTILPVTVQADGAPLKQGQSALSLSSLIEEGLHNNPRLSAAKYRAEAAKARVTLFRSIPDPMLEYEYDRITPGESMAAGEKLVPMKTLAISQEIPFPTKIFLREKSAQKEANALEQEYQEIQRSVVKEIKEAYFNLFLNLRKAAFMKDSLRLAGQFVEVSGKKYAISKVGQQDVLRAQVDYSKLSNQLVLYEKEASVAKSFLLSLLGRDDGSLIDIGDADPVKDLELKEEDIVALAKKNRPELKSVREMLGKAEVESSLSKQELLPDITVKYKREEKEGAFRNGEWAGMIGINVPLWFWGKQLPAIREARANLMAAKADYKESENTAVFEAKSTFAKYEAARKLVSVYETGVLPQATSAVTTARRAYESGGLSFLELLDSLRTLRDLQMEYFDSVAELQIALADLERFVGDDLWK